MMAAYILLILYFTGAIECASKTPCDLNNDECVTKSFNKILPEIANGIPALGVKSSDPVLLEKVIGVFPKLMYIFTNTTFAGYKDCVVTSASLKLEMSKFTFHLLCPSLISKGNYEMHGEIYGLDIDGLGNGTVVTENIHIQVDADIEKYKSDTGKEHILLKNLEIGLHDRTNVTIQFDHINKNNDEIAAEISKRFNENWLEVSKFAEGPVYRHAMKLFVININSYLEKVPLNELFHQLN